MILIYTHKITNRTKYIFNLMIRQLLGVDVKFTTDAEEFSSFDGVKFTYCNERLGDELFFTSCKLLFERGITTQELSFTEYDGLPAFYPVYSKESALPFDPFAAAFYLVSRYEEYLPYRKDKYGRFQSSESLAHAKGFLQKPLINIWALQIGEILKQKFPGFSFPGTKYEFIPTIDIDAAWSYKQKGLFRTAGGFLNSLIALDIHSITERAKVILGLQRDPFDTYELQLYLQKKYKLKPIYFILFAQYGLNDKNIPVRNMKFQQLIKSLADYAAVGIHPSYGSNDNPVRLKYEVEKISKVLNREITKSRQHFLKLILPTTYRNLTNLDITDDYSMGYAAQTGFRGSICSTFNFYDLDMDTETKLRIHPFTFMDGTLRDYMNVDADRAMNHIKPLIDEVKAVNGTFISLWHNESLSNKGRWIGWDKVYEDMITEALP